MTRYKPVTRVREDFDYLIYKDGDYFKLLNGESLSIEYKDKDAATVIQKAADEGKEKQDALIYLAPGLYPISKPIIVKAKYPNSGAPSIIGLGRNVSSLEYFIGWDHVKGVVLYPTSDFPIGRYLLTYLPSDYTKDESVNGFELANLWLIGRTKDGNNLGECRASGLGIRSARDAYIHHITIGWTRKATAEIEDGMPFYWGTQGEAFNLYQPTVMGGHVLVQNCGVTRSGSEGGEQGAFLFNVAEGYMNSCIALYNNGPNYTLTGSHQSLVACNSDVGKVDFQVGGGCGTRVVGSETWGRPGYNNVWLTAGGYGNNTTFVNCKFNSPGADGSEQERSIIWANASTHLEFIGCTFEVYDISGSGVSHLFYASSFWNNTALFSGCKIINVDKIKGDLIVPANGSVKVIGLTAIKSDGTVLYSENGGPAIFSGDGSTTTFSIPHSLVQTPITYYVQKATSGLPDIDYVEADGTNLTVHFKSAPASGTDNVKLRWYASIS